MRIKRVDSGWWILAPGSPKGRCLGEIARSSGYRVGEICCRLQCSDSYLRRVFLRDVGVSPKQWLREERMLVAKRHLEEGSEPWSVAEFLGFASPANFSREFRMVFGVVPSHWREFVSSSRIGGSGMSA